MDPLKVKFESSAEVLNYVKQCLSQSEVDAVKLLFDEDCFKECLQTCSWDLIPIVCEYFTDDVLKSKRALFSCCEELLDKIVEYSSPEEVLLVLIDEAEKLIDVKLVTLLKPIQKTLLKLNSRLDVSVEWCFNSIYRHMLSLPLPEDRNLEGDERKLLDCDPSVQRIRNLYSAVVSFYDPFVDKVIDNKSPLTVKQKLSLRTAILRSCFRLLGKPLIFMDLESNDEFKSQFYFICDKFMHHISQLSKNLLHYLEEIDANDLKNDVDASAKQLEISVQSSDSFSTEERIAPISLGVLYYLIFAEKIKLEMIPFVYSPLFLLEKCFYCSSIMLKSSVSLIQRKGLLLANAIMGRIYSGSVPRYILESTVYSNFIEGLFSTAVYCCDKDNRTLSVSLIKTFLNKFDYRGQYVLLLKMVHLANHPGLIGYLATLYKNLLNDILNDPVNEETSFFTPNQVKYLLNKFCDLPHKAATDLVDCSDQIISSLNLIRFLLMKDTDNRIGVWSYVGKLDEDFLSPLREGINMSRAHYQVKLQDINEEIRNSKTNRNKPQKSLVSINVGNEVLPDLPPEGKLTFIQSALNSFDLIESLVSRVNEIINQHS